MAVKLKHIHNEKLEAANTNLRLSTDETVPEGQPKHYIISAKDNDDGKIVILYQTENEKWVHVVYDLIYALAMPMTEGAEKKAK